MPPRDEPPSAPVPAAEPGAAAAPPPRAAPLGRQARIAVAALVVCALAAFFWPRGEGATNAPGGFVFDSSGRAATIGSHLAPVSLVHFWATWCPPCLTEIPALQRLTRDLAPHQEFAVVMIAVADDREKVKNLLGQAGGTVLYDNWDVAHRYGTKKLPESYLVVRGQVVEKWIGATDWDDQGIRRRILEHLREPEQRAAVEP
jgi:thiol-disulfide isomerase/thioredoxin